MRRLQRELEYIVDALLKNVFILKEKLLLYLVELNKGKEMMNLKQIFCERCSCIRAFLEDVRDGL